MIAEAMTVAAVFGCTAGQGGIAMDSGRAVWMAAAWTESVRPALADELGLRWTGAEWIVDSGRTNVSNLSASAYFAQPYLDAGISDALARCDRARLDEIAGFYLAAIHRFERFGELARARGPIFGREYPYDLVGSADTRTLPWIHPASGHTRARSAECLLCVAQFLHPAARLIRLFAVLPLGGRNDVEQRFVTAYLPLITHDQVLRFAYDAPIDLGLPGGPSQGAVAGWKELIPLPSAQRTRLPSGLLDVHLWLIAEAAEVLAAHATAPNLVRLSASDSSRLREFVRVGELRFSQSGTTRVVGDDSAGRPVRGLDFFEGEFAGHRDDAFAGDSLPEYPSSANAAQVDSIGWDVMHAIRLPVVLRSLRDVRGTLDASFPADSDLAAAAHQLTYKVFDGDFERPLFRNFMDGTDGWYRVGYSNRGKWGYPPSRYCDARDPMRPCLGTWALPTWGLLASDDPRLVQLAGRLTALAGTHDTALITFRDRHYFEQVPFAFDSAPGGHPSLSLFELLADFAPPAAEWTQAVRPN